MATTWIPRTTFEKPRQWLLTNGEVVTEPALEQTTSGLKVRVPGTNLSAYKRDLEHLITSAVDAVAKARGCEVWMRHEQDRSTMNSSIGFDPDETRASVYLLDKDDHATTLIWWRFKHPTLPIEAVLSIKAMRARAWNGAITGSNHQITTKLTVPNLSARTDLHSIILTETSGSFPTQRNATDEPYNIQEFVRDNPPGWDAGNILGTRNYLTDKSAVEGLLDTVRKIDEIDTLEVLDVRDEENPAWLPLELHDTNVNAAFLADLAEYLEGAPTIQEALKLYDELRQCMRGIGLVLEEKTETDFQKGLLGDEPEGVTVNVARPDKDDQNGKDTDHWIRMHLPTGTFTVECSVSQDRNHAADRWDEALAIASLSGEEGTLLAFAREVSKRDHEERTRNIVKARQAKKD